MDALRYIDLFCGLGGFRIAANNAFERYDRQSQCVFSSDIDSAAQDAYEANFGERPTGDITKVRECDIPDHDVLFAGFPCQPFSIIGDKKGFEDTRGTLFFDIARILRARSPSAFVLENVRMLRNHNKGQTLDKILRVLSSLGYRVDFRILNALDFGLPQKRERIFIVGFRDSAQFRWPVGSSCMKSLSDVLEKNVPDFYFASEKIRTSRKCKTRNKKIPAGHTIWHENKSGNIGIHEFSCAMRASASYNYLLVDGERRLTEREMLRLQGFPDNYKIVCGYSETRKQAGNSVAIPVVEAVVSAVYAAMTGTDLQITDSDEFEPLQMGMAI